MATKMFLSVFIIFCSLQLHPAKSRTWVRAGYWYSDWLFLSSEINSSLFTHLICAFASPDSTSYQVSLSSDSAAGTKCPNFTDTVKQKNQSVTTLLSIGGEQGSYKILSSMVSNFSSRKSFIDSSIRTARLYGFQGLDFSWVSVKTSSDSINMGLLFQEWREAIESEAENTSQAQLILTAAIPISPNLEQGTLPIDSMEQNLNWVFISSYDYYKPGKDQFTAAHAALYGPAGTINTNDGIGSWIRGGLSADKLVLSLPFYGYEWKLVKPEDHGIGAPATATTFAGDGQMTYKRIKFEIKENGATVLYNSTYEVKYFTTGTTWIGFDDVEVVRIKVSYAKEKKLLGYVVLQVAEDDDDWALAQAAAQVLHESGQNRLRMLAIILPTTAGGVLLLGSVIYCFWIRKLKSKERTDSEKGSKNRTNDPSVDREFNSNAPNLITYKFREIEAATNGFSFENKLGQGGYGPVYKGILPGGQEIAVKKLSKTSTQGYEEFRNEVILTAKLQHVNLVRLLGFCTDREEQMLIYEYMPNKSLDFYLFDINRRYVLDWTRRIHIIEGVTQGLLYLQEYSRMTIIHRDLKASNVLLDEDMKPKISDFGMARIFAKDEHEANTRRIVGTYGYVPPEYVKRGIYSTKSDVYSFGVMLLQIISDNKVSHLYGPEENLTLLEHAYELWKDGKGMEFMDQSLDDTDSSCKLMRCLQIALLCVQETPNDRPSMLEVSSLLKNETSDMMIPKKPAFSNQIDKSQQNENRPLSNYVTVSEVAPR